MKRSLLFMLTSVEVDPLGVTRIYTAPDFHVRERITTHAKDPGVLVRFTVKGPGDPHIQVHFQPSLNLMWPAGIGGQETSWDQDAQGFLLSEPTRQFRALISSPEATEHSETNNDRRGSDFNRYITLTLEPRPCADGKCAALVFAGQSEKDEEVHATTASLLRMSSASATGDVKRFGSSEIVKVTTPDPEANRAIEWAQIALEQSWTCNARLGCAVVAGYGPSHGSRRPQYAWYFAGDGLLATEALLHEGNYERAAEELDFLYRYQNSEDGMMWHEISQSAGFLNWARDYPYLYVHVDLTFDFLTVVAEYDRVSGDQAFLSRHWPATLKAYQYCLSTLDKGDGLPRVPADKMSGNEQDRLTDELTLSASWVSAAHAMFELAASMHDEALSRQAESASLRARESIRSRYWDSTARRWDSGFTRSGTATDRTSAADLAAIASGVSRVIALSTDKAVNPINLYGASKLAAEKVFIAANNLSAGRCKFSVVRYGNVVGSRGSVLPFFQSLIDTGATSLPLTDDRMTRFWITMQQAIEMVNTCHKLMRGREVYVPKIPSICIRDLIVALGCDFKIIGIRPGEKIHETLISEDEAHNTMDCEDYFVINGTLKVPTIETAYKSDTNPDYLNIDGLRRMLNGTATKH